MASGLSLDQKFQQELANEQVRLRGFENIRNPFKPPAGVEPVPPPIPIPAPVPSSGGGFSSNSPLLEAMKQSAMPANNSNLPGVDNNLAPVEPPPIPQSIIPQPTFGPHVDRGPQDVGSHPLGFNPSNFTNNFGIREMRGGGGGTGLGVDPSDIVNNMGIREIRGAGSEINPAVDLGVGAANPILGAIGNAQAAGPVVGAGLGMGLPAMAMPHADLAALAAAGIHGIGGAAGA